MPRSVLLITPPSPFLKDQRVMPFLGPLSVAASLEHAGWPVETLDLSGYSNFLEVVKDHLQSSAAQCVGITATTPQLPAAVKIASVIREVRPSARIILGGTHASLTVAAYKYEQKHGRRGRAHRSYEQLEEHFDVIVAGDGEETIFLACSENPPKLIDADGRKSPFASMFLDNERLDASPFPARHLIDLNSYHYKVDGVRATTLIAQLGCPFECGFCAGRLSPMLRHIRTRSVENIVKEMVSIYETYGYRGFMFYDDELNVSKSMVELMRAITSTQRELGVEFRLRGFIKAELFTDEQAEALYNAGFRQILVGFESGSPRILENIKKRATREDNTRCVEIAHRHGLTVKALMSVGHPGESRETIEETKRWLFQTHPEDFDVAVITPYPGSPYYDEAVEVREGLHVYTVKNGDRLYQEEVDFTQVAHYFKGIPGEYVSHVYTDFLSAVELAELRDQLEDDVRRALTIPYPPSAAAVTYEHSMGQTSLPSSIFRQSVTVPTIAAE